MSWKLTLLGIATTFVCLLGAACTPLYVLRAAYEQSIILLRREQIFEVMQDPRTSAEERTKLGLVLEARDFAEQMGLTPKRTFTQYTRVSQDVLAWVLSAAPPDSFALYQWWFPIVGYVPYKGYFERSEAEQEAKHLEAQQLETWVRGTEAFSTLGWFNDPLLSTTIKHPPAHLVNTVLHETVHSTLWIPNHVDFNESLANFVGHQGAVNFFTMRASQCAKKGDLVCVQDSTTYQVDALYRSARELEIARVLDRAYRKLKELYESDASREEKIRQRDVLFSAEVHDLRVQYPDLTALHQLNNAKLLQLRLYQTDLDTFAHLFKVCHEEWQQFFAHMKYIQTLVENEPTQEPFAVMKQIILGANENPRFSLASQYTRHALRAEHDGGTTNTARTNCKGRSGPYQCVLTQHGKVFKMGNLIGGQYISKES